MAESLLWRNWRLTVCVLSSLLCYSVLTLYQLPLPGLAYDEVFFGPTARGLTRDFSAPVLVPERELISRFSPLAFNAFSLSVGSASVPVMLMPYWGALKVYLMIPVFSVWGISPHTIRLPALFLGGLTLLFFSLLLARCCSVLVALLASVLLASDPSYLFYTRHDFGSAALSLFLVCCPLWCLVRWRETNRASLWAATFFLFGVGLYNRLDYLAFLVAAGMTVLLCFRKTVCLRVGSKEFRCAVFFFLLGFSPFLLFLGKRPAVAASTFSLAAPPQNFSAVAQFKGYTLWTVLNGTSLYDFFSGRSDLNIGKEVTATGEVRIGSYDVDAQSLRTASLVTGTFTPYVLLFFAGVFCLSSPPPLLRALMIFLVLLALCVFAIRGALRGHHFVLFLPFVQAFLAASLIVLWQKSSRRVCRVVLATVGIACVAANIAMDVRYHRFLAATGGRGLWSEAVYDLAQYLQDRCREQRCLIGDWGLGTQVVTLAEGPLSLREFFWPYIENGNEEEINALVRLSGTLFVFYADPYVNFSRPKRLLYAAAQRAGYTIETDRTFVERDGTPVIEVVKMGRAG